MAINFAAGFDEISTATAFELFTQEYADGTLGAATIGAYGRRGTNGVRFVSDNTKEGPRPWSIRLQTSGATAWGGAALKISATGGASFASVNDSPGVTSGSAIYPGAPASVVSSVSYFWWLRYDTGSHLALRQMSNGTFSVWRGNGDETGDGSATLLGTSTYAFQLGQTYYIEWHVLLHGSAGTVLFTVNGDTWLTLTGVNTLGDYRGGLGGGVLPALWDEVVIGGPKVTVGAGDALNYDWDDLVIGDTNAASATNHYITNIGDVQLDYRGPTANGTYAQFTPSAGVDGTDEYAQVDETAGNDGDSTYNASSTVNNIDSYVMQNTPIAGANVLAVMSIHSARRATGGASSTAAMIRTGGADYVGTARGNTSTYTYTYHFWTKNPGTAAVWSDTEFDALENGYKKVS